MPQPDDCGMLSGYLEAVEAARSEVERTWGVGRVELIAGATDADLLARFRRQQATWSVAYQAAWDAPILTRDLLAGVQAKAASMQRGWNALAAHAAQLGHREIAPWVWEVRLADGSVAAFVQTDAEASKVIADGRHVAVYTAAEVGHVIDALPAALQLAKAEWPGAKVQASRPIPPGPAWKPEGDEIPFGESS
jgi:hypothetical protein